MEKFSLAKTITSKEQVASVSYKNMTLIRMQISKLKDKLLESANLRCQQLRVYDAIGHNLTYLQLPDTTKTNQCY